MPHQNITKKKPPNATKADSQTPTNFHICCFFVVIIQRQFVELLGGAPIAL
jgi:hypothetical protein